MGDIDCISRLRRMESEGGGCGGGICAICSTHKKGRFPLCNQHKTLNTKATEDWHGHIKTFSTAVTLFHCLGTTSNCTFQPSTVLLPFVRVTCNYLTNEQTSCKLHAWVFAQHFSKDKITLDSLCKRVTVKDTRGCAASLHTFANAYQNAHSKSKLDSK